MILFSKRLTPTLSLALHLKITIQSQKPQLSNELIPVHSPLLRESYLVSYPPLTYMLKFSGFADLTSCQDNGAQPRKPRTGVEATNSQATDETPSSVLLVASHGGNVHFMHQGRQRAPWCTKTDSRHTEPHNQRSKSPSAA